MEPAAARRRWPGRRDLLGAAVLVALALGGAHAAGAADWEVKRVTRPDGTGARCVLESGRQSLSDGYQTTTAQIVVDRRMIAVTSPSNFDPGAGDIGLAIDGGALVPMDRLEGRRTAVFESTYERLVAQFKAGARVEAQLRFWPEWPATGTHAATFSLIGFTKAYGALAGCR